MPDENSKGRYVWMTTAFSKDEARRLNEWIERQNPRPSKSAAIREFVLAGLAASNGGDRAKDEEA